jgi:hypothetical protein
MEFILRFETDSDAFADDSGEEVSRILLDVAREFSTGARAIGGESFKVYDVNGNAVGAVSYCED